MYRGSRLIRRIRQIRSGAIALLFLGAYGIAALAPFMPAPVALADAKIHKSYVCKYVGTPGVDERLQIGQNPIYVDNNSLLGPHSATEDTYVGQSFSDGQVKSVVIVANTEKLDPEPGVDQCPAPEGPAEDASASFTLVPATCTLDGSVTFTTDFATLTSGGATTPGEQTATFTADAGHTFADGSTTLTLNYTVPAMLDPESEACATPLTPVTPTAPTVTPVCGPNNDIVSIPSKVGVTYTSTGWVNGSLTITAAAAEGYVLDGITSWTFTDENVTCEGATPHQSYVCKYVGTPGVDERLQTGNNPIFVDNHSLLGHDGTTYVGEQFSDAQGKSIVIVANTDRLDPEPGVDQCPAPEGPAKDASAAFTLVPATCTLDGSVTFTTAFAILTAGGETTPGAHTATFTSTSGHTFADGSTTLTLNYTVPAMLSADSEECYIPTPPTPVTPGDPTVTIVCGPNNDVVTIPTTAGVTYTDSGWVNGTRTISAAANENFVLNGTSTWTFTDTNTSCGQVLGDSTTTPNVLAASTTATPSQQLENTGNNIVLPIAMSTGVLGLAVMTILQNNSRKSKFAPFARRMIARVRQALEQPFLLPMA